MGHNPRTEAAHDRDWLRKHHAEVMASGVPASLNDMELELDRRALTRPPRPVKAKAWVRYGGESIFIEVLITAWTSSAVAIKWKTSTGAEHKAWVWNGAVESG